MISQQSTAVDSENTETVSALVYTYDKLDRNVEIAKATGETQQEYMYNPLGDVIYEKSDSSETRTIYDDYSRVVQEITQEDYKSDLDGLKNDTASDTYSDALAGHTYTYADNGNLASETNRLGVETKYSYFSQSSSVKTETFDLYVFTYDEKGIRTSKTVNGKTTYYTTVDGTITSQYELDEQGEVINEMVFLYDSSGNLIGFTYGGNTYFYIKNHMNDVMGIADAGGTWLVSYTYDAYGTVHWQYETNSEVQTDIDITELAELNPMLYRSYYCDRESGIYYLQSRYYLPDFGRFFNADLPEYAKLQKDDYAGTNLFAYCNNDPVNNSDPSGYWGKEVHSGYKSKGYYYNVCTKTRRYYYGTYYWAIICGFKEQDAKFLAQCCNFLDTKYPSTKYPSAIAANANGTTIIYNGKELNRFKSWQYWHFNGYKKGYNDTRRDFANDRRKVAVKNWKKDRTYALRLLAYGLHAIQDISAHGQIGRGSTIPQHIFLSPKNKSLFAQADTVQGYMWSNSSRNGLIYVKGSVTRLLEAQRDTYEYLNEFIRLIGGKHKLK